MSLQALHGKGKEEKAPLSEAGHGGHKGAGLKAHMEVQL